MSGSSEAAENATTAARTAVFARGSYGRRFAALIVLAALADWLFYGEPIGISATLFALLAFAVAAFTHQFPLRPGRFLGLTFLLTVALLPLATGAGFISIAFTVFGTAYVVVSLYDNTAPFPARVLSALRLLSGAFWRIVPDSYRAGTSISPIITNAWRPAALLAWVVPLIFGTIFVMLFADANPIFESGLGALNPFFILEGLSWNRALFWLFIASFTWPFVAAPIRAKLKEAKAAPAARPSNIWSLLLGKSAILRSLILFNLLFAVQSGLDITYLWAGRALPGGLTYASYAHRGAYPLILTALLAAGFAIFATKPGTEAAKSRLIQALVLLWIGQNVQLVLSSILRLRIYVQAYSLTELRLAALMWMLLVVAGLIFIVLRIAFNLSNTWLIRVNLIACAMVLYAGACMNFPGIVAMYDVKHCSDVTGKGSDIDLDYLQRLGPQSIPALDYFETHARGVPGRSAGVFSQSGPAGETRQTLRDYFASNPTDWRGWDFWSWQLNRYLRTHQSR